MTSVRSRAGTETVAVVLAGITISRENLPARRVQWLVTLPRMVSRLALHPLDVPGGLRIDADPFEAGRSRVEAYPGEVLVQPLDEMAQHEMVLRGSPIRVPRLGEAGSAMRELIAVPGFSD